MWCFFLFSWCKLQALVCLNITMKALYGKYGSRNFKKIVSGADDKMLILWARG